MTVYRYDDEGYVVPCFLKPRTVEVRTGSAWIYYTLRACERCVFLNNSDVFTLQQMYRQLYFYILQNVNTNGKTPECTLRQTLQVIAAKGIIIFVDNAGTYCMSREMLRISKELIQCFNSRGEERVALHLKKMGLKFSVQKTYEDCVYKGLLKFDFCVDPGDGRTVLIEFDGIQHTRPIKFFGGIEGFRKLKICDRIKDRYCQERDLPLLRIPHYSYKNIASILQRYFE